eukprot:SAG11_NODE_23859_length_382_cov_0.720848_1_plen_58_part_01
MFSSFDFVSVLLVGAALVCCDVLNQLPKLIHLIGACASTSSTKIQYSNEETRCPNARV